MTDNPIIPDFGGPKADAPKADKPKAAKAVAEAAPAASGEAKPRKMVFIASKGNLDMAYPALIMANACLLYTSRCV